MRSVHVIQFSSLAASNFTTTKSVCGFFCLILLMKNIHLFQPLCFFTVLQVYSLDQKQMHLLFEVLHLIM